MSTSPYPHYSLIQAPPTLSLSDPPLSLLFLVLFLTLSLSFSLCLSLSLCRFQPEQKVQQYINSHFQTRPHYRNKYKPKTCAVIVHEKAALTFLRHYLQCCQWSSPLLWHHLTWQCWAAGVLKGDQLQTKKKTTKNDTNK